MPGSFRASAGMRDTFAVAAAMAPHEAAAPRTQTGRQADES
jgi:hypothetical protein